MKNILATIAKGFFKVRDWNPNSISGLGSWEDYAPEDAPPIVAGTRNPRGVPHSSLPLAAQLRQVEADLKVFDESLPNLRKLER